MKLGDKVWIHAMGSYYPGEVVKLTDKRATVRYKSGAGDEREKAIPFNPEKNTYFEKYQERFPLVPVVDGAAAPRGSRQLSSQEKGPNIYQQAQAARAARG
jgi:hypothetical protein